MTDEPVLYLVEDDALMRASLRRVFAAAQVDVQPYASGNELLAGQPLAAPGALLLDVMMPGMNGLEVASELHKRGVTLPTIFLTGSGDVPMAVQAMRDGAFDFLEKPFDNAHLVARVRKAFAASSPTAVATTYAQRRALLTPREREVLDHMVTGKTSKVIGRELGVSHRTIEIHRAHVMDKMEAGTLANLVRMSLTVTRTP